VGELLVQGKDEVNLEQVTHPRRILDNLHFEQARSSLGPNGAWLFVVRRVESLRGTRRGRPEPASRNGQRELVGNRAALPQTEEAMLEPDSREGTDRLEPRAFLCQE
jgi:hypothetical protein